MNTIVIPYFARPIHLELWLEAFREAYQNASWPHQFVLVEWNEPDEGTESILHRHCLQGGPIPKHLTVKSQHFNKSEMINAGAKASADEWITSIDIDCLMDPHFLMNLEKSLESHDYLGFQVHHVPLHDSRLIRDHGFSYAKDHIFGKPSHCHDPNGMFCIRRDAFLKIGGMNEAFTGYGFEDRDFQRRATSHYKRYIIPDAHLYDLDHPRDDNAHWRNPALMAANEKRFREVTCPAESK